ncbi:MAG: phenylacetate--CoA ligase PaaK [Roseiarcus sp.]
MLDSSDRTAPEPIEMASRDEIAALQLSRLRATARLAYERVPHYQRAFAAAGVHPDDLRSLDDLRKFPFTDKGDLRANYPFGMFAVPRREVVRIHASSGTSGKPTVVGYTRADLRTWAEVMARSIRAAGGRPGDIFHITHGYGLFTGGLGVHYGAEHLGCTVVPISGGQTPRQVQLIEDFRPDLIVGTPSYMLAIADEFERQGLDPRRSSLRVVMCGAEPWTVAMRHEIEARFEASAFDLYGISEIIGPGVACECAENKDGLHIWEDHFYPEIVDPATGKPAPDGQRGELVLTTLTKEAMPLIRYRTRDLTRLLPGTARTVRRIEKIAGRTDDMLIIRGVNVFPGQIEELLLKEPMLSPHYVLEVSRRDHLDALAVVAEARPGAGARDGAERQACVGRLAHAVKSYIGVTVQVRVVEAGELERSAGKAKRIVDLRPQ